MQQPSAICNTISREVGKVLDETNVSPDPREEVTALPTDSIVDNQPNTSSLEISTAFLEDKKKEKLEEEKKRKKEKRAMKLAAKEEEK